MANLLDAGALTVTGAHPGPGQPLPHSLDLYGFQVRIESKP